VFSNKKRRKKKKKNNGGVEMDYYERRKRAFRLIDKLFEAGVSFQDIVYQAQSAYGVTRGMVDARVELLKYRQKGVEEFQKK
jgi:hypothetical protein